MHTIGDTVLLEEILVSLQVRHFKISKPIYYVNFMHFLIEKNKSLTR